jgi:hypothetical protein
MLTKVIPPGSQQFDMPPMELIKAGRSGLRGHDFKAFVKRAGHTFADAVRRIEKKAGDVLVHQIAMGATEYFGPNRNMDGWRSSTCEKYHPTFVKFARCYRDHANRDPKQSYGVVKLSEYNDLMKRIELVVALSGTKEAADRNGGFVADGELQLLNKNGEYPVSMAARLPYDVCVGCSHRAKNRSEYCLGEDEGGLCKRGGCRNRLGLVHEDGFVNYVDNPEPTFFDISRVVRGADRTAFATGIYKAAAAGGVLLGGAAIAEAMGVSAPAYLMPETELWPTRVEKLAAALAEVEASAARKSAYDAAFHPELRGEIPDPPAGCTTRSIFAALAREKIALPIDVFARFTKNAGNVAAAQAALPGVYSRLLSSPPDSTALKPYSPHGFITPALSVWATKLAADYSLAPQHVQQRLRRAELHDLQGVPMVKAAGVDESGLSREYALYKLALLGSLVGTDQDFDLTAGLAVRQHYIE